MGNDERTLDGKVRKYNLVVHNLPVDDKLVREAVNAELEEEVHVTEWETTRTIEYKDYARRGGHCSLYEMDMRYTIVAVKYQEYRQNR